jgi:hypothetical protein
VRQSSEIHRIWWEGEESVEWPIVKEQCLKKYYINEAFDESLLRCNPLLIFCVDEFYKKKKFNLNKRETVFLSRVNSNLIGIDQGGYHFQLSNHKNKLNVLLKENCHESYLDQRIYGYSEQPQKTEGEDYRFDNFDQIIYVDKHLVTNFDVNQWILSLKNESTKEISIKAGNDLFLPATELTLKKMENYCQFKGKELLSAQIFDAATFLPNDLEDKTPKNNNRSPYFWSKNNNEKVDRCDYVFSKECLLKQKYRTNIVTPTWAGLFDSMGGVLEAFNNPIDSEKNLKVSSFYLPNNSKWHRLGKRSHWDGEGFSIRNFSFENVDLDKNINKFQVGFRCMRRIRQ